MNEDLARAYRMVDENLASNGQLILVGNYYLDGYLYQWSPEELEDFALQYLQSYYNSDRYDFSSSTFLINDSPFVIVDVFLTNYRIPIIRALQYRMYCHLCCGEHIRGINTYIQIFEHLLSNRVEWSDEFLDYGFNFVLSSLYRVYIAMNRHLRESGMPTMN